jgi:hypothetical protein
MLYKEAGWLSAILVDVLHAGASISCSYFYFIFDEMQY